MKRGLAVSLGIAALLTGVISVPHPAEACGVVTATIAEDPKLFGVQDPRPNLIASAHRTVNVGREYEFAFPLKNESLGNTAWERDRSYQIAVLVGPTREFTRVTPDTCRRVTAGRVARAGKTRSGG